MKARSLKDAQLAHKRAPRRAAQSRSRIPRGALASYVVEVPLVARVTLRTTGGRNDAKRVAWEFARLMAGSESGRGNAVEVRAGLRGTMRFSPESLVILNEEVCDG